MAIFSKACKPDNFELHHSLKLSFTNIWNDLHLNFTDCKSFLDSKSPNILSLCKTNLDDSIYSGSFSVTYFCELFLENSVDSTYIFRLALLHPAFYFFFLYWSPSLSLCTVFDSISSNIDEVLSINPSANVFVFGDFNVHHKDWVTYFGGTDQPGGLCYLIWPYSDT